MLRYICNTHYMYVYKILIPIIIHKRNVDFRAILTSNRSARRSCSYLVGLNNNHVFAGKEKGITQLNCYSLQKLRFLISLSLSLGFSFFFSVNITSCT